MRDVSCLPLLPRPRRQTYTQARMQAETRSPGRQQRSHGDRLASVVSGARGVTVPERRSAKADGSLAPSPISTTISQGISRIIYQHLHVPRLSHRGLETIAGVRGQDLVRAACGRVCGGLAATVAIGLSSYGGHRVTRGDGETATWWWRLPDPSPYTPRTA